MRRAVLIFTLIILINLPVKVNAFTVNERLTENFYTEKLAKKDTSTVDMNQYNQPQNCNTLLGNPDDSNSVAWLINKALTYATIAGMVLVVVLSSIDFMKVIVKSDDDEMAKATKKLGLRLVLAALLFFVPTLTNVMLSIFGLTSDSTCGITQ